MTALDFRLFEDTAWMHEYQAFILSADRQIISSSKFSSPDDKTARLHARQSVDKHDVELWQQERWVGTFTPAESPPLQSECDTEPCLLNTNAGVPVRCDVPSCSSRAAVTLET